MYERFLGPLPVEPTPLKPEGSWEEAAPRLGSRSSSTRSRWQASAAGRCWCAASQGRGKMSAGTGPQPNCWVGASTYEVITPAASNRKTCCARYDGRAPACPRAHAGDTGDDRQYVTPGLLWRALDPRSTR